MQIHEKKKVNLNSVYKQGDRRDLICNIMSMLQLLNRHFNPFAAEIVGCCCQKHLEEPTSDGAAGASCER